MRTLRWDLSNLHVIQLNITEIEMIKLFVYVPISSWTH